MSVLSLSPAASSDQARRNNRARVLRELSRVGTLARPELARRINLTEAAISRITRELLRIGLLSEHLPQVASGARGRPSSTLAIAPDGAFVLGLDIGANGQWISVANALGEVIARDTVQFPNEQQPVEFLTHIGTAARRLLDTLAPDIPRERVLGAGVAAAGIVEPDCRTIAASPNLGWGRVDAAAILEASLGIPVTVEARPRALALAELRKVPVAGNIDLMVVLVGLGLGSCLVVDGQLLRGINGRCAEVAHLPVRGVTQHCHCGRNGCLDSVASGRAVLKRLKLPHVQSSAEAAAALNRVLDREREGDDKACQALAEAGTYLGGVLAPLIAFARPSELVLTGPLARAATYVDATRLALVDLPVAVRRSEFDADAVAAQIALETFVFSESLDLGALQMACAS